MKNRLRTICFFAFLTAIACDSVKFSATRGEETEPGPFMPECPAPEPLPPSTVFPPPGQCLEKLLPLNFWIALDGTASMGSHVDEVKKNLKQLLTQLKGIRPIGSKQPLSNVKISLLIFDDVGTTLHTDLTSNVEELMGHIDNLDLTLDTKNVDGPEAGLIAFEDILRAIQSHKEQAIQTVLMITDNKSHRGGEPVSRDYSTAFVSDYFSSKAFQHFLLYDSAKSDQWYEVREAWKYMQAPTLAVDAGMSLGFPLSADTLHNILPQDIASKLTLCH